MKIKKANIAEHKTLTAIMRTSKAFWDYDKSLLAEWKDELTISQEYIKKNNVFSLWTNEIIGFYSYFQQGSNIKLDNLFLLPGYIGKGMGRLMMSDFLKRVSPVSKNAIVLEADPNAASFYEKFDFSTISLMPSSIPERFLPIMISRNTRQNGEELIIFESDRFYTRHLKMEDLESFYDMQSNPKVMKYIKPTMNEQEAKIELSKFINYYESRKSLFRIWAVIEQQSGSFIGICGVYQNSNKEIEIAYRLREKYWGQGYGRALGENLINFCFETLNYSQLTAYVRPENVASIKILNRLMIFKTEIHQKTENTVSVYQLKKENWS